MQSSTRPDIVRWWYEPSSGSMHTVIRGIFREGSIGRGWTISPYYFHLERYDPFTVQKRVFGRVATGFQDRDSISAWAQASADEWHRHFAYRSLRRNLDVNRLLQPRLGVQVDVHYNFLSAFVHGAKKAHELIFSHNIPMAIGHYDHCSSELILLYAIALSAAELEIFGRMARRRPHLALIDRSAIDREVKEARDATNYFWFLSGEPHLLDRIQELHSRIPRKRRMVFRHAERDPGALDVRSIRYYTNPLERLRQLHSGSREYTTGLGFVSPFRQPPS